MKFKVTAELAMLLKILQNQGDISAKELAAQIGKSPSYVSKLENGDVKMIRREDLTQILKYLTKGNDFFEETLPAAVRCLQSFMEPERLSEQIWLLQYDIVDRPVKVDPELVEDISARIEKSGLSIEDLVAASNAESETPPDFSNASDEIIGYRYRDTDMIRMRITMTVPEIYTILEGKKEFTNFLTIFTIVFQVSKYERYKSTSHVPPDQARIILRDTRMYLDYYNVHSLTGYGRMISSEEFLNRQEALLDSFDSVHSEILDEIITGFHAALKHDVMKATQALDHLRQSFGWDLAFMMKLLEIPYNTLGNMSYYYKKQLLDEIMELVQHYADMPDMEKKMENY